MSVIIEKGEIISKSPINCSTAKMMYSFSKADRFREKRSPCETFYYQLPDVKSTRSASFGFGPKYDFTKNSKSIKAPYYQIPSDFNAKKPHSPAFTFGISREHYEKVYTGTAKILDKNVPGPGKYDYIKPFGSGAKKYTMQGKIDYRSWEYKQSSPGPAEYPKILNPNGKYPNSSQRNIANIKWSSSKEPRFYQNSKYNNLFKQRKQHLDLANTIHLI